MSVLEVGCGAGRDGTVIRDAGLDYTGVDLSASSINICARQGLRAAQADATSLPFDDSTFDAARSMSTLMHLPNNDLGLALRELARVVRPGGVVEIGVWGHTQNRDWTSPDGRLFRQRSDRALRAELSEVCTVLDFATRDWQEDDAHYQWARTEVTTP
ncbi:class I SAM-dependent methyltransferase [Janibacter limosus]|nr:class I SAM-dependent methyltransferase [Janibacter limosus]